VPNGGVQKTGHPAEPWGSIMNIPSELKYSKDHEWCRVEGDIAVVGITDFAQSELGDVVFLELPESGAAAAAGKEFGTIEAVKAVSELFAPVSGEIIDVNTAVADTPETVNQDPYGEGWMIKIKMSDPAELERLLDADAYNRLIGEGGGH
jgi:glycine cleavage system H protein